MSKTETQSKAESLAKMLEFGAFSPNLLQNEIGVRKAAAEELRRLDARVKSLEFAFNEWHDKTDWVQETAQALELGMHRADVLRARIEALDAENKALRERLAADIDPALSREVYRACEDLPEDWAIRIDLQSGYGGVKLIDPDGEESELPVDGMLSDAMRLTIDAAMAAAKNGGAA